MVSLGYIMSRYPTLTETFVLDEMLELERRGVRITVFPLLREHLAEPHPQHASLGAEVIYTPFLSVPIMRANLRMLVRRPWRSLTTLLRAVIGVAPSLNLGIGAAGIYLKTVYFADQAERRGITHLHAHFCTHPTMAAWIIRRLTGIRYSFTAHGSDLHVDQTMLAEKLRRAELGIMISRYNLEFAVARLGAWARQHLTVIHCGIDIDALAPTPVDDSGPLRILCVASLREVKGHRHLLQACRLLGERGIDWTLTLVGDGPERVAIETLASQLQIGGRLRLLGARARPEVLQQLHRARVVALTSVQDRQGRREGIPVSLMEAMALERPVVSSDLSGIPELVRHRDTGLLATPGDPRDIADQLAWIADHPGEAHAIARRGRRLVASEFGLKANAGMLLEAIGAGRPSGQGAP